MLTLQKFNEARERLYNKVHYTPLLTSITLNEQVGASVFVKAEHLQKTGSFKIRGAMNRVLKAKENGALQVITASSGNHGQAVAYAARSLGMKAIIVVPKNVIAAKERAIKSYGGEVIHCGTTSEERLDYARRLIKELEGAEYIPPYDDYEIMAGQGTVGIEILELIQSPEVVVVPIGGGGLISGIASAVKRMNPAIKVIGVEPITANDTARSIQAGKRLLVESSSSTIADGLRASIPGELTFPFIQTNVDEVVTVTEAQIQEAFRFYLARMKQVVEPSGAATLAALRGGQIQHQGGNVVLVASGGNVDLDGMDILLHS
ncbi:threonine ammonia-lyase [Shouchella patagoniensis]|uniref:threonine ammonia-lyase n=1 Tax=Shouchella patagoniensis TaxID=228576 RepID=UPI0009950D50|nr:threonine/serine dehydratase [Shouchella patagoniensis]